MATLKELKKQVENANALGIANLTEQGVELSADSTTYEIMQSIAEISGGGGASLNLAYGETAPEDTSKLWVKANEPDNVKVGSDVEGVESIASVGAYLPTATRDMGCARVGNKVYLFGGSNDILFDTINVFDIETQTVTTLTATLPDKNRGMGCCVVGTKIYLFGGDYTGAGSHLNTINVFDTETETLTTLSTTLTVKLAYMGCASVGTKIYLFGGKYNGSTTNKIFVFDTETEIVTELSTILPQTIQDMGCASVGTKIYLFGGYISSNGGWTNTINVFDIETNTITTLTTRLPLPTDSMGCATIGTKVYLFGGYTSANSEWLNTINVFDTETNTITTLDTTLHIKCGYMGCSAIGNKIYLFGGYDYAGKYLNTINCFTLTHELTQGDIEIQSGLLNNKFNLINTDTAKIEIGVENVYVGNENNEAEVVEAYLHNGTDWQQI